MADHLELGRSSMDGSVLALPEWARWNQLTWGLEPERVSYGPEGKTAPRLEGMLYLDRRGRVRMPRLNPYLPFVFRHTDTAKPDRLGSQWLAVSTEMARDLRRRGMVGGITLPPGMLDARAFQWAGFTTWIRYTYLTPLPVAEADVDKAVRAHVRKATSQGYTASRSDDWSAILEQLQETEERKSFSHHLDERALRRAAELLGADAVRGYAVSDSGGRPVGGGVRLHRAGAPAHAWIQGAARASLRDGAVQLLHSVVLRDLEAAGAPAFDFGGANMQPVAAAKAKWGFPLVPYLTIATPDVRHVAGTALSALRWTAGRRSR